MSNIWLQPGTRAHMVVYKPATQSWQLWTSTNCRTGDSDTWFGTFIQVYADGSAIQCIRTETEVSIITLREAMQWMEIKDAITK